MDNPEDELCVAGNMDFSNRNSTNIDKGTVTVGGNIYFSIDSYTEQLGDKVILNGDGNQYISGTLSTTDLIINTKGTLTINTHITAEGTLTHNSGQIAGNGYVNINNLNNIANGYYGGNVSIMQNNILEKDLIISGNLSADKILDLNGHSINAGNVYINSTLDINQGMLNCENAFVVNKKGILQMQNESDLVCVGKNMTFNSSIGHSSYMTAGTIELYGDFKDSVGYTFTPSGTHKTVLGLVKDKESVQTVSFPQGSTASRFNTLVLRKKSDKYSFSRDVENMAVEVIYEVPDYDEIAPADKLIASAYDSSSVTIEFDCNSFEGTVGYRIFRDGELIGSCSQNTYTDTGLSPETTYVYQVYPFDKYWILAQTSPTLEITTLKDDEAPQRVEGLSVSYLTGAKVGLSWNSSSDNYKVKEYNIYKNGNLEYTTTECSIYDENVTAGEVYKYQISAVDMYGNESEYSDPLSVTLSVPVIKAVSPIDGTVIKAKEVDLKVSINKLFSGGRYSVDAYYYDEAVQDWVIINQKAVDAQDENVVTSSANIP
ncbi:MAG: hypothetical protein IKL53_07390, partial [Lachnospiraceae bacterium]|nr:hypothetical protein [Lachnospiraceae bacterium]